VILMQNDLYDSAEKLFAQVCTPAIIRKIEQGANTESLWLELSAVGFGDALLPESADGAGLRLTDVWPLFFSMGRHAVPLPYAHTLLARAWLQQVFGLGTDGAARVSGNRLPQGSITFAPFQTIKSSKGLQAHSVGFGMTADWVLAQCAAEVWLLPVAKASRTCSGGYGSLDADLFWSEDIAKASLLGNWNTPQFQELAALSLAALIAGASDRVFEMTLAWANQREQFGKPIGRFQALQQQISEVAEQVFGARMAAEMSCRSANWQPVSALAALAKAQTSQAVARIVSVAHAVHGAIGVTQEFDLQLYTRRLTEWAKAGGGAEYWSQYLGQQLLAGRLSALDFVRIELFRESAAQDI
jgi:alkylation response protein AidB-like acyl-CoA dehydrogenase